MSDMQASPSKRPDPYTFTVFTPTYNRAHTLHRVYESLIAQTFRHFEWVIVDDGSTDNTRELVAKWQQTATFPIRYEWQENTGKAGAWNHGVRLANGELFLTLDSDDACVPNALERLKYHWDSIPGQQRDQFSAVTALCINQHGKLVGDRFPEDVFDSTSFEMKTVHNVFGEKWGFQRTEVMGQFNFPEIPNEKYISPSIVWNRISLHYKTRYINEALRIYYEDGPDSITRSSVKLRARNPKGASLFYREYANLSIPLAWKIKGIINYIRFSLHGKIHPSIIIKDSNHKALTILVFVAGFLLYQRDALALAKSK